MREERQKLTVNAASYLVEGEILRPCYTLIRSFWAVTWGMNFFKK